MTCAGTGRRSRSLGRRPAEQQHADERGEPGETRYALREPPAHEDQALRRGELERLPQVVARIRSSDSSHSSSSRSHERLYGERALPSMEGFWTTLTTAPRRR